MQKSSQSYVQTQFATVGQGELLIMLYDGALRFLAQAKDKIRDKDHAAKGMLISRALDVINELDGSLNQQLGGELSKNLHQLYFMCSTKLLQANLRMDAGLLDSVAEVLTGLRNAYAQIQGKPEVQAAEHQIAQRQQNSAVPTRRPMAPATAPPAFGGNRSYAQNQYTGAASIDTSHATTQAAQATRQVAEKAAESLTRQAEVRAQAAVTQVATAAEQALPATSQEAPPAPPVGLGNRRTLMAQYGKMANRT